jgi:hypothetical protein
MTIEITKLLEFLCKAQQLSPYTQIDKRDEGYKITMCCDWHDSNHFNDRSTFITNEGKSSWNNGEDYDLYTMDSILDDLLARKAERETKAGKRRALIARLTDEEKELLGLS